MNAELISQGYAQVSTYKDNQRPISSSRVCSRAPSRRDAAWGGCVDLRAAGTVEPKFSGKDGNRSAVALSCRGVALA